MLRDHHRAITVNRRSAGRRPNCDRLEERCLLSAQDIVINEFRFEVAGESLTSNNFVELYNGGDTEVDISGWVLGSRDVFNTEGLDGPRYAIDGGTRIAAGGFFVIGLAGTPNVDQVITQTDLDNSGGSTNFNSNDRGILWENRNETIELHTGEPFNADTLIDAVYVESNKGGPTSGTFPLPQEVLDEVGPGYFGNVQFADQPTDGNALSLARVGDGVDTNNTGADFRTRPITPGYSNVSSFAPSGFAIDEAITGEFSEDRNAPTALVAGPIDNRISGEVGDGSRDYLTIHVPEGQQLAGIVLEEFVSTDDRAFLGMQAGTVFTEPPTGANAANLLGYVLFEASQLGTDVLDDMNRDDTIGFTTPLPSGDYVFWIQQLNATTDYTFNFIVEPADAPVATSPMLPDPETLSVGQTVPGFDAASFVSARVIDPTVVDDFNPNAIVAPPTGTNAIAVVDPAGGGNLVASDVVLDPVAAGGPIGFSILAYIQATPTTDGSGISDYTAYGIGSGPFLNRTDPAGLLPGSGLLGVAAGVGWYLQRDEDNVRLILFEASADGSGDAGEPGAPNTTNLTWNIVADIDLLDIDGSGNALPSDWYELSIEVDPEGNLVAFFGGTDETFNGQIAEGRSVAGSFYASWTEAGAFPTSGLDTVRPATFVPLDLEPVVELDFGGNLRIDMTSGDDEIVLTGGTIDQFSVNVVINGQDFGDFGVSGTIILDAGAGDDIVDGSALGSITLVAGLGQGNDLALGGLGNDAINGGPGDDTIRGNDGSDLLFGSEGDDSLVGQRGFDQIEGQGGNDTLIGNRGGDTLFGGDGDDLAFGGAGGDRLGGNSGNDDLRGQGDDDTLQGGNGQDFLTGGFGDDLIFGGADDDTLEGGNTADQLFGGLGDDQLFGQQGFDQLFGEEGDDTLEGGTGTDSLDGGPGADLFESLGDEEGQFHTVTINPRGETVIQRGRVLGDDSLEFLEVDRLIGIDVLDAILIEAFGGPDILTVDARVTLGGTLSGGLGPDVFNVPDPIAPNWTIADED